MAKIAYLTVDDGPTENFATLVDFLDSKGIKAIWFCIGRELERFPQNALYALKKGHVIGSHSYSHPNFSEMPLERAREEIEKTDRIIDDLYARAGARRDLKVFRFPGLDNGSKDEYGACRWDDPHVAAIQRILRENGYRQPGFKGINYAWYRRAGFDRCLNVDCTYDTFDWVLTAPGLSEFGYHDLPTVLGRIDENVPEGGRGLHYQGSNEIIMMHAQIPFDAFTAIVDKLLTKNLAFRLPEAEGL